MNIGNKIKELRKQKGITQEQLADYVGVSFQAVSKWENQIALPDITLAPVLANYFGVSMDVLFDFDLKKNRDQSRAIAQESWKYRRENELKKAKEIVQEGLKQNPDDDILLTQLLYTIDYGKNPDEVLKIASKVIDITKDESMKYDAYRFMAYAYKSKNDLESARKALEQIPDLFFARLTEKARVLEGREKWDSACKGEGMVLHLLMQMKEEIAECLIKKGETKAALNQYQQALAVLDILEATASPWDEWRKQFQDNIANLKK